MPSRSSGGPDLTGLAPADGLAAAAGLAAARGGPAQLCVISGGEVVADKLDQLRMATGADELAITTITHQHRDRVRSYELLAEAWRRRHPRERAANAEAHR